MEELNEIDLIKEEENYKKNIRYKKIRNIGIFLSAIIAFVFIILNVINSKDKTFKSMEINSKLLTDGSIETREEIEYISSNDDMLKRILPYKMEDIKDIDVRVVINKKMDKNIKDNTERAVKTEETTKEEYDNLSEKEKNEKLYYYLGYISEKEKLEESNIDNEIFFKTAKELKEEKEEEKTIEEKKEETKEETKEIGKEKNTKTKNKNRSKDITIIYIPINKTVEKTKKVVVNYTLKNTVTKYKDIAELKYDIIYPKDQAVFKSIEMTMEFPNDGIRKEEANIWYFGTYKGKSEVATNKLVLNISEDLKAGDGLKLVTLFNLSKLGSNAKDVKSIDEEYKETATKNYNEEYEKQVINIEKYLKEELRIKSINRNIIYISAIFFSIVFVKNLMDIISEISSRKDIEAVIKSFKYYDNPPEEFKFNFTKINPLMPSGTDKIFKAIFLKLIYKGLVIPKKQKKLFSLSNYNFLTKTISKAYSSKNNKKKRDISEDIEIEYVFILDEKDYERQDALGYILKEDEYVYKVLKNISTNNEVTLSELSRYLQENFKTKIDKDLSKLIFVEKEKLLENGFFEKDTNKRDLKMLKQNTFNIIILLIFLSLSIFFNKEFSFPIYISVFSFIIAILNSYKYKIHLKGINAKGLQAEAQIQGFRNFLRDSSLLDLKADNKKDINSIRQYLMYSVYFDISDRFMQKSTQYYGVDYRRIYEGLEPNKEDEELRFKYGDAQYLLRKLQESMTISKTYYKAGLSKDGPIGIFDINLKEKRTLKIKK